MYLHPHSHSIYIICLYLTGVVVDSCIQIRAGLTDSVSGHSCYDTEIEGRKVTTTNIHHLTHSLTLLARREEGGIITQPLGMFIALQYKIYNNYCYIMNLTIL